ncbi:MAG: LamG domain-containing protein [Alphaproteobacteria bacterium PRO2]|nr:LamG domain-containing protein [Alphaproteobacteria bacterium PRO2]
MVVVDRPASKHNTYVNGALVTSDTISATFDSVSTSTHAAIGASSGGNHPFLGKIDDVRIYNRALSAAEVEILYEGGRACVSYGACASEAERDYDPTDGIIWCDGANLRAIKVQ